MREFLDEANKMLVNMVDKHAAANFNRIAVVAGDTQMTYGDLRARSVRLGALLREWGVGPRKPGRTISSPDRRHRCVHARRAAHRGLVHAD